MRTITKSFAVALVVSTLVSAPVFAARNDVKHRARTQDEQPSIVQRVLNHIKHVFDVPVVTQPSDVPVVTQPSDTH
jgi:hypothetical protein